MAMIHEIVRRCFEVFQIHDGTSLVSLLKKVALLHS
jgi:hypothetical protein